MTIPQEIGVEDALRLTLHELQVHQIELESQNEELRRTQSLLDESKLRYFDLYDHAPVGYCSLSQEGIVLEANLAATTLLGLSRHGIIGQKMSQYICDDDQDSYYLFRYRSFKNKLSQTCDVRIEPVVGSKIWVNLVSNLTSNEHEYPMLRVVMTDITERKRMEILLRASAYELEVAKAMAEKASVDKSDLLSSMGHDLRTPLHSIVGYAQLLESSLPALADAQLASLKQVISAGWYLLKLINELLDSASIEAGKASISIQSVSLAPLLLECEVMLQPQAEKRGVIFSNQFSECSCFVLADPIRLKQVICNLLSNAIKYNRKEGVVSLHCVTCPFGFIRLEVSDTGPGLNETQLGQLFQPFHRLGQTNQLEEGTGIGLVVSKRLIEMMDGKIGVQSTVGVGSTFWIELPRTLTNDPSP